MPHPVPAGWPTGASVATRVRGKQACPWRASAPATAHAMPAGCLLGRESELAGPDDLPPGSHVDADARPAGGARLAARSRREDELPGHRLLGPACARRRRGVGGGAHREHAGGFSGGDRRRTAGDAGRGALPDAGLRGGATSGRDRGGAGAGRAGRLPGHVRHARFARALFDPRGFAGARHDDGTGTRASCASCPGEPLSAPEPSRAWQGRVPAAVQRRRAWPALPLRVRGRAAMRSARPRRAGSMRPGTSPR